MIAKVIVDNRAKATDKAFDYLIPDELEASVSIGTRVIVPFSKGNNEIEGFCVGVCEKSKSKNLKSVIRVSGEFPAFDEKMLETIEYMHEHYMASYLDLIHTVVPSGNEVKSHEWIVIKEISEERSQLRAQIVQTLLDNGGGMETASLCDALGKDVRAQLRDMIKKGTDATPEYFLDYTSKYAKNKVKVDESTRTALGINVIRF